MIFFCAFLHTAYKCVESKIIMSKSNVQQTGFPRKMSTQKEMKRNFLPTKTDAHQKKDEKYFLSPLYFEQQCPMYDVFYEKTSFSLLCTRNFNYGTSKKNYHFQNHWIHQLHFFKTYQSRICYE